MTFSSEQAGPTPKRVKHQNRITVVLGRKGSGKTTLVKSLLRQRHSQDFVIIVDTLGEYDLYPIRRFADLTSRFLSKRRSFVFRPESDEEVVKLLEIIWFVGNLVVCIEEVDVYCSAQEPLPELNRLLRYGRHRDVSLLAVSRRPADIPRLLTSQADEIITFEQTEPRDLVWVKLRSSAETMEAVRRLPKYHYLTL